MGGAKAHPGQDAQRVDRVELPRLQGDDTKEDGGQKPQTNRVGQLCENR